MFIVYFMQIDLESKQIFLFLSLSIAISCAAFIFQNCPYIHLNDKPVQLRLRQCLCFAWYLDKYGQRYIFIFMYYTAFCPFQWNSSTPHQRVEYYRASRQTLRWLTVNYRWALHLQSWCSFGYVNYIIIFWI